jgi:NADPH:quinone reductase-like Zn-dependent oxidoreductase
LNQCRKFIYILVVGDPLVKRLGADVVIDYKTQDFEDVLHDYDVVLHSQGSKVLEKSLRVLKRGRKLVSISGPADPAFAQQIGAPALVKLVIRMFSAGVRRRACALGIDFSFLFMRASGSQLGEITRLIEAGAIRPVVDKVFPFESTNEAMAYVESGCAKGKVVVSAK